ncbi:hypothetical protein PGT21_026557 [Puccinia graminis f. sp. tritici]|uniref:Uncharacterized protein n=1 Tax=Puccinia graminis f. sp. tritici TaxID=56615 RepID=A0A5B0N563_PUCGR|nr:hypothetical protein PGT21_001357 [Puccinia graminis f. sp. tritici]KAA1084395.1 hypothetical protein PGT21_026557 [Puccinia graminis f. sp. tritici]KAA1132941.1 hypothetical protein PGTUg99_005933 [Puccinia graminis f. sp. tritici]
MSQYRLAGTESQTASPETQPQAAAATKPQAAAETEPQATAGIKPQAVTQTGVSYEKLPEDMPDDRLLDQALPTEKPAEAVSDQKNQAVTDHQIPQPEAPQAQHFPFTYQDQRCSITNLLQKLDCYLEHFVLSSYS